MFVFFVYGCTDTSALNYNLFATIDDSSCCYNLGQLFLQLGQDIDGEDSTDESGRSISLSSNGSTSHGASHNDGNGLDNAGHTRIYNWNGSSWIQLGQDIDGEFDRDFGKFCIIIDGSSAAIGAVYNDGNGLSSGHVRIYNWNGISWIQRDKI